MTPLQVLNQPYNDFLPHSVDDTVPKTTEGGAIGRCVKQVENVVPSGKMVDDTSSVTEKTADLTCRVHIVAATT